MSKNVTSLMTKIVFSFAFLFLTNLAVTSTVSAQSILTMKGANLAGAEFSGCANPGILGTNYFYPSNGEVDYYISKGMNTFRIPFCWERLQLPAADGTPGSGLDAAELSRLRNLTNYATSQGAKVILDPHNYARYNNRLIAPDASALPATNITITDFATFWALLANEFENNSDVIFGLMNEPNTMSSEVWRDAANAAIAAIRNVGATNQIMVPGNAWTGAHSWNQSWYGTANASTMLAIVDPNNNLVFEVHQYFDADSSGQNEATCELDTQGRKGSERLVDFTNWLRANNKVGFLGEFGVPPTADCLADLAAMLNYMEANDDVWAGWTYWAGGPEWGNYPLRISPNADGTDRPQMDVLEDNIKTTSSIRSRMNESLGSFNYDASATSNGAALGTLTINFNFAYQSGLPLDELYVEVTTANNAFLRNADSGSTGGVGSIMSISDMALPDTLSPALNLFEAGEMLSVAFSIGLLNTPWGLNFNLYGAEALGLQAANRTPLASVRIDSTMVDVDARSQIMPAVFLPVVGQ